MYPCSFARPDPIVFERFAILPLAEESPADSGQVSDEGFAGEAIEGNDLRDTLDPRLLGRRRHPPPITALHHPFVMNLDQFVFSEAGLQRSHG